MGMNSKASCGLFNPQLCGIIRPASFSRRWPSGYALCYSPT